MLNEGEFGDTSLSVVSFFPWGVFIHYWAQPGSWKAFLRGHRGPWEEGRPFPRLLHPRPNSQVLFFFFFSFFFVFSF